MWNEINSEEDLASFMDMVCGFHDSCLKEFRYISGAYVNPDLSMYPVNDKRSLRVLFQRQFKDHPAIEIEFSGLKYLKIFPCGENYTCEILDATMLLKDDCICWCDCGGLSQDELEHYQGTSICAAKARWRAADGSIGEKGSCGAE